MATNTYPEPYRSAPLDALVDPSGCYSRECTSYCAWKINEWTGKWPKHTGDFNAKNWVKRLAENGYKTIVKGVLGIARLRLNASSAVTVVVLANLIADLIYLLASQSTGVTVALFTAAATFTVLLSNVARHLSFRRALDNLRLLTSGIHMYSTEVIPNERDAAEVTRGMQLENPVVAYNAPITDQPRFVEEASAFSPPS